MLNKPKAVLFDTNASYNPNAIWNMLEGKKISAYGSAQKYADDVKENDIVFYCHKGVGIIAAAKIIGPAFSENDNERYHDVQFITPIPVKDEPFQAIPFKRVVQMTGKSFYWARTIKVPALSMDEAELLIRELNNCYEMGEVDRK